MKAGRELDAIVAEKVMGYEWFWARYDNTAVLTLRKYVSSPDYFECPPDERGNRSRTWNQAKRYSTDLAAAFSVLDALRAIGWVALLYYGWAMPERPNGCTLSKVGVEKQISVFDKDLCVAICNAALETLTADDPNFGVSAVALREQLEGFNVAVT